VGGTRARCGPQNQGPCRVPRQRGRKGGRGGRHGAAARARAPAPVVRAVGCGARRAAAAAGAPAGAATPGATLNVRCDPAAGARQRRQGAVALRCSGWSHAGAPARRGRPPTPQFVHRGAKAPIPATRAGRGPRAGGPGAADPGGPQPTRSPRAPATAITASVATSATFMAALVCSPARAARGRRGAGRAGLSGGACCVRPSGGGSRSARLGADVDRGIEPLRRGHDGDGGWAGARGRSPAACAARLPLAGRCIDRNRPAPPRAARPRRRMGPNLNAPMLPPARRRGAGVTPCGAAARPRPVPVRPAAGGRRRAVPPPGWGRGARSAEPPRPGSVGLRDAAERGSAVEGCALPGAARGARPDDGTGAPAGGDAGRGRRILEMRGSSRRHSGDLARPVSPPRASDRSRPRPPATPPSRPTPRAPAPGPRHAIRASDALHRAALRSAAPRARGAGPRPPAHTRPPRWGAPCRPTRPPTASSSAQRGSASLSRCATRSASRRAPRPVPRAPPTSQPLLRPRPRPPLTAPAPTPQPHTHTHAQTPLSKSLRTWFFYATWPGRLLMQLPLTWCVRRRGRTLNPPPCS
jgi:hypothetical protein